MKAAIRSTYGEPDVLEVTEVLKPEPSDNEILIKVYATSVNRTDCAVLKGSPFIMRFFTGLLKPRLASTGTDFAGEVEAVGSNVTRFKTGDRVWGFLDNGLGSHAEYFVMADTPNIQPLPEGISFIEAAGSIEGAHYAINFLNKVNIRAESTVLINGVTGAIGSAMLQIVKNIGAHVVATANTPNLEKIKDLGADRVINFDTTDFTTDVEKFDFILDAVGKSHFEKCRPIMKENAVYVSSELGPKAENIYLPFFTRNKKQKVIFPVPSNIPKSLDTMSKLLQEKKFRPLIDREYPLDQIREAFTYVDSGQKTGNVILNITQ